MTVPADKPDRTAIFEKTKMCKFHILGMCAKGSRCRFAHDRSEMNGLPNLYRTKLCKTLINTGFCDDENCRYAHSKEELRLPPEAGHEGRSNNASPLVERLAAIQPSPGVHASADDGQAQAEARVPSPPVAAAPPPTADDNPKRVAMNRGPAIPPAAVNPGFLVPGYGMAQMFQMYQIAHVQAQAAQLQALASQMQQQAQVNSLNGAPPPSATGGGHGLRIRSEDFPEPRVHRQQELRGGSYRQRGVGNQVATEVISEARAAPAAAGPPLGVGDQPGQSATATAPTPSAAVGGSVVADRARPDLTREPAHIAPSSLRSIQSSSSICSAGGALDTVHEDGVPPEQWGHQYDLDLGGLQLPLPGDSSSLVVVKNTFLDEKWAPSPSCMRTIQSAAGRLDALGEATPSSMEGPDHTILGSDVKTVEDHWRSGNLYALQQEGNNAATGASPLSRVPENKSLFGRQVSGVSELSESCADVLDHHPSHAVASPLQKAGEKRLQENPAFVAQGLTYVTQPSLEQDDQDDQEGPEGQEVEPTTGSSDGAGVQLQRIGITVKNTFLDFEPERRAGLRAVHTYAGQLANLDEMG